MGDKVQDIPGLYEALRELARVHTVWSPEGGLFTDGNREEWQILRMAVDLNETPSPTTAREIADGIILNLFGTALDSDRSKQAWRRRYQNVLEAALLAYGNARIEEAANIAKAIDSGRGNEKQIAYAIRSLATKEGT